MQILNMTAYEGPNIYSYRPVIRLTVDIGALESRPTNSIPGFADNLLQHMPSLREHLCSRGRPGGFVERMIEGTYMGHVIEHVALELQALAGSRVGFGRARGRSGQTGVYDVVFEYEVKEAGLEAGRAAVEIIERLLQGDDPLVAEKVSAIARISAERDLGPSTKAIAEAARQRDIPVIRTGDNSLLQLGWGARQQRVLATVTSRTSCISADIASDKWLTRNLLADCCIPVPEGELVSSEEEALQALARLGGPLVVKPRDANKGKGVSLDIWDADEMRAAFKAAVAFSDQAIVERFVRGTDYRVLVVGGRVAAVAERVPPSVVGDGVSVLKDLIDRINSDPRRGDDHEKPLTKIKMDSEMRRWLKRKGLSLVSVPRDGEVVKLRQNGNLSTGGMSVDVTDQIHPYNAELAVRAVRIIGLDVAGVDIVAEDIGIPIDGNNGAVIEINASPGLRMHQYPANGEGRDVAGLIVNTLFPFGDRGRIPLIAVTGTNGKTTTTRLIAHIMSLNGKRVGMTTSDGVYIGGEKVVSGDTTGPWSCRMVLRDPSVEVAVLEVARGGIIRGGLAYDCSDIAVITNITEDHIGLDGVETLQDLANVKSLVGECVRKDGYVVLNAHDPVSVGMRDRFQAELVFFGVSPDNPVVADAVRAGSTVVYLKEGKVVVSRGGKEYPILPVSEMPVAFNGSAKHNVENALAATAAVVVAGVPFEIIRRGLETFQPVPTMNPGRFNVLDISDFTVVVDYAHNPAGYSAAISTAKSYFPDRRLVGVVAAPGDRTDSAIREMGAIAGKGFDRIVIKEDHDKRGRRPGEVANILMSGALESSKSSKSSNGAGDRIKIILDEAEAITTALNEAVADDVIMIFYEKFETAMRSIAEYQSRLKGISLEDEKKLLAVSILSPVSET